MRIDQGTDMTEIDYDAVTLLGLAIYRASLIEFGRRDATSRARMHTHDIPITDTITLLHDNARCQDLLLTEPGHPDFPHGRLPPVWADTVAGLCADPSTKLAEGPQTWDSLLQKVRAVLTVGSVTTAGTVKHLAPLIQRHRLAGWYERSTAVTKPDEPTARRCDQECEERFRPRYPRRGTRFDQCSTGRGAPR
ncbi:hypothetical protein ACIRG5_45855 [Lentzea sp. NPDC102401]|uniref:hypothetical protein n=1 Tax=Lentzea sp. NPDC102401 TaxID=3364128 RepID=UPI00381AB8ED